MSIPFELAGGSIVGADHRAVPKNNQDAWHIARDGESLVAVVCDGCGSSPHSETGAQLGARLIAFSVLRQARRVTWSFDDVRDDVLAGLRVLGLQMASGLRRVVEDYFLFSVIGVVFSGYSARFFSLGDGLIIINGEVIQLGPFPNNEPPYLGYGLLGDDVSFTVERAVSQDTLWQFLIGCDGAGRPGLLQACEEDRKLPGLEKTVGPISRFWEDDAVFSNPDVIRRRLKLIARDWPPKGPEHGLLADDTTIVVGRRRGND